VDQKTGLNPQSFGLDGRGGNNGPFGLRTLDSNRHTPKIEIGLLFHRGEVGIHIDMQYLAHKKILSKRENIF
jgi:hypothetical protein